jgi:hypothetical protein
MRTAEHLQQARHNEALASQLGSPSLLAYDWAITALFYCALHFVDAYLFDLRNLDPEGHTARWDQRLGRRILGRNDYVKLNIPAIYQDYEKLYNASRRARYEGAFLSTTANRYYQSLKNNEFTRVRQFFWQQKKW